MAKEKLSSRERYLTTFKHQEPDRVPILLDADPTRFFAENVTWFNQFERAEVLLELGCDPMINLWLPTAEPAGDVEIKTWREKKSDGKIYIGKEFHTPKGVLRQIVEETDDWCSSLHGFWVQRTLGGTLREEYGMHVFDDHNVSRRTEPWVKGPEDLEKLPYILQKPAKWKLDEWVHDAQRAMEFAAKHNLLTMVRRTIVSDASQWFCDIPWFMMQLYDDPGFVEEFLGIFEKIANWQAELALAMKPDVFQHRGWYDSPDFWGGHFEKYILPMINRQADIVHQADALHCYLLTEGWGAYFDEFSKLKSDILWGADPYLGKATLKEMKNKIGKDKTILGGISTEHHLINSDEQTIRQATRDAIEALAPGGSYIFASSAGIGAVTVEWNLIAAMIDEVHKVGRYPINL